MKWLKNKLDGLLFTLFSTGKPFDPSTQERTDAIKDIDKKKKEAFDKKLRKMFRMEEE